MTSSIIKVQSLKYKYEQSNDYALSDLSFNIKESSWTAIVGQNGSGKSTLTKLLNGILVTDEGSIKIDNIKLTEDTIWDIRKRIGIVFQNPDNQFVGATVEDDVAFGLENMGMEPEKMHVRVHKALEMVNMLDFVKRDPQSLSGGQKQRVAIAGIIALEPKIIILDEATSMLDPSGRKEIMQTIATLKEKLNLTVVSITHDVEEVLLADDVLVINQGVLLRQGSPENVFMDDELLKKSGLDLPFTLTLQRKLIEEKININSSWIDEEGLVEELWKYHLNK